MNTRKNVIGKTAVVFLGVMVLLTFFSNTLNNFTSPRVNCENPMGGELVKEIHGSGAVEPKRTVDQYTGTAMKVLDVLAKPGDRVKKGQVILTLDTSEAEKALKNEKDILLQKELNVERMKAAVSGPVLSDYDHAVASAEMKLEKARRDYENGKELLEAGAESEINVKNAWMDYENARLNYEVEKNKKAKALSDNARDLKNAEVETEMQARKVAEAEKALDLKEVKAPMAGILLELGFPKGTVADGSKPLYRLADAAGGYQFRGVVDGKSARFLKPGDRAEVTVNTLNGQSIQGKILEIFDNQEARGSKKDVLVDVAADGLTGGETGTLEVQKSIRTYDVLVPNGAIGQDISGYFVYVVKDKSGPLGNEHHAEKVKITIGESDDLHTGVLSGINTMDRVITGSDKQIADGMRVTISP